ncbi:hypothetical protein [Spiroplasma chrysopicola]|uniref:Uncharacterized protein n=1 Tax=Spiroplasma chrysopicola DF-1 TaxID=1276227 RepID=R4U3V9_9MOLU|nr:hypothetical protein [Spiroplasma chrysopicola]AGM25193.1 hypothetical protein SCHRY_v1c06150 [Spiroplasma chrysopicola DF-1]
MNREFNQPNFITNDFSVVAEKGTNFKTITSKEGDTHDLFEFWVLDNGQEVHCIAWDATAHSLKTAFENPITEIKLTYKERQNKFTNAVDYSIRNYEVK